LVVYALHAKTGQVLARVFTASSSRKSRSVSFGFSSIAFNPEGEDFAERCLYSRDQPVIVWLRIGNTSNQALLRWFVLPEILRRIELKTQ
jgi:hypothetical protein